MSVIVAQLGARMHYAVPRILDRAGLLERLYTDICARKGWPRWLGLLPGALRPARLQRLLARVPEGIPPRQITAFTNFGFEYTRLLSRARDTDERNAAFLWSGREFCRLVVAQGFGDAQAVYVFNSAGLEVLQAARSRGIKGVLEQTIAPRALEQTILRDEAARFPGWEAPVHEGAMMDEYSDREKQEWAAADLIVCGSEFVRDGIVACGGDENKCVVVPYGVEHKAIVPARSPRSPGPLRVMTVGAVCLRKGAPHVLAAAKAMASKVQFRWAGAVQILPEAEKQMLEHVELIGVVPRSEIAAHYAWADVFLLPSLCEGSATSTYEALLQGLPVICTSETGSTVRDGEDGFIIPARDSDAIIEKLSVDPARLTVMSANARVSSSSYSLEKYGERLLAAFRSRGVIAS
jgi:glycosyltransferase involved in cell wall biosynthesis